MKEINIKGNFMVTDGDDFVTFIREDSNAGIIPDNTLLYPEEDIVVKYDGRLGIVKPGKFDSRVAKVENRGKIMKISIIGDEFSWVDDEEELAKEMI